MELDFSRKEKIVGTFIVCIVFLLLSTVVIIGRGKDWFKTYVTYHTIFDQSYNLEINTPVKLFNADIGKVKKIDLVGDKVKITLNILYEFRSRIKSSSRATVQSPTLIGSEFIAIIPGKDDAPLIQAGGIIPSKKKKSIADFLDELQIEKTAKMIVEAAQELTKIVKILREPQGPLFSAFDNLNKSLSHIEKITGEVESGKGTVGGLIQSRALLDQIHDNLDEVGKIIENILNASAKTPATVDQLEESLATLQKIENGILESVPNIQRIMKDAKDGIGSLKTVLGNIEKGSHDIPRVIRSTSQGIKEIRESVDNIDKVVQSLQQNVLIKSNLPPEPKGKNADAGLRP